jgi:hypothetical protein
MLLLPETLPDTALIHSTTNFHTPTQA